MRCEGKFVFWLNDLEGDIRPLNFFLLVLWRVLAKFVQCHTPRIAV